jgi:hypothetical protein
MPLLPPLGKGGLNRTLLIRKIYLGQLCLKPLFDKKGRGDYFSQSNSVSWQAVKEVEHTRQAQHEGDCFAGVSP